MIEINGSAEVLRIMRGDDIFEIKKIALAIDPFWQWRQDTIAVESGRMIWMKGRNGVGKSTLLRMIAGFLPHAGDLIWKKRALQVESDLFYHQHMIFWHELLNVEQYVALKLESLAGDGVKKTDVHNCMEEWGLIKEKNTAIKLLSQGQKARVGLSVLHAINRDLWLLDEPFVHLDAFWFSRLTDAIKKHLVGGGMVLLASHQACEISAYPWSIEPA